MKSVTPLSIIIRDAISRSELRGKVEQGRELPAISFHQYMTLCLYHPEFGYYRSGNSRVGREGDFYTSAYIGDLMGGQLATYFIRLSEERFPAENSIEVIDWGGGTGRLGRQMLEAWEQSGSSGVRFTLTVIDGNPEHRLEASAQLDTYIRSGRARVISAEDAAQLSWEGKPVIVVANELLDAFPVHRIARKDQYIREWGVAWQTESDSFVPCLMTLDTDEWATWLKERRIELLDNQTFEVNLGAAEWLRTLARTMDRAIVVLIDYGDDQEELTAAHRMDGTLLCYYKHRAHNDPYVMPGEQDMTAHVNFSHMRSVAEQAGWQLLWYGTQKHFLIETGIMAQLSAHQLTDPFHPVVRRNRAIRQLLLSDGMSELFKVQVFGSFR